MSEKPRWFHRIKNYNKLYDQYADLLNMYQKGELNNFSEYADVFKSMKSCYEFHAKVLKDILKFNNIKEYLPVNIFIRAKKEGIINNADIWLDFIADVNELAQTTLSEQIELRTRNIIEKYKDEFEPINKIFNKYLSDSKITDDEELKEFDKKTKPKYKPSEIGITNKSYKKLINFFKKAYYVNYVWMHGSRMKGLSTPASDIDLIADYPLNKQTEFKEQLAALLVPYRVECTNIRTADEDEKSKNFICSASIEAKLIYRAEDFE